MDILDKDNPVVADKGKDMHLMVDMGKIQQVDKGTSLEVEEDKDMDKLQEAAQDILVLLELAVVQQADAALVVDIGMHQVADIDKLQQLLVVDKEVFAVAVVQEHQDVRLAGEQQQDTAVFVLQEAAEFVVEVADVFE